jgi:hypothetical protein
MTISIMSSGNWTIVKFCSGSAADWSWVVCSEVIPLSLRGPLGVPRREPHRRGHIRRRCGRGGRGGRPRRHRRARRVRAGVDVAGRSCRGRGTASSPSCTAKGWCVPSVGTCRSTCVRCRGRGARALREAAGPAPDLNEVFWVVHMGNREIPSSQYRI